MLQNYFQAVGPRLAFARQRAINYLESKVDEMKNSLKPYETALLAYALMLSKSPKADSAFITLAGQARFEGKCLVKITLYFLHKQV